MSLYQRIAAAAEPTQVVAQYVWGARPGHRDELVFRDRDADGNGALNERLYCLMDYFNPVVVVDVAGEVRERYAWTAFGIRSVMAPDWVERESSSYEWDFGFHGQFLDVETGWYDYGFRYYMPLLGRWPSRDPIAEEGGVNLYLLLANNAVNSSDYLGLQQLPGPRDHPDSFGETVPHSEYPEDSMGPHQCHCVEKVAHQSPTKKNNRARPTGPAGIGGACSSGEIVTLEYEGLCIPEEDCCEGKKCAIYVQWECVISTMRQRRWSVESGWQIDPNGDKSHWIPLKHLRGSLCK